MDNKYFNLTLKSELSLNAYLDHETDYDELISEIEAKIYVEDYYDNTYEAGRICCRIVELNRAVAQGLSLFHLFDTEADLHHFSPILDDGFRWIRQEITELFIDEVIIGPSRVLLFDRLVLSPEFRGNNLGLKAMNLFMAKMMSSEDLAVLSATPLQFCDEILSEKEMVGLINDEEEATKKLIKYYQKAAFVVFYDDGESNIMLRHCFVGEI